MSRHSIQPNRQVGFKPAEIKALAPISLPIVPKKAPAPKTPNELLYYGFHTSRAVFKERRKDMIRAYCTEERVDEMKDILKWCSQNKKAYHVVTKEDLEKITGSVHHEGAAVLAYRKPVLSENEVFAQLKFERQPLIVLGGVMNPHNVGSIMRVMAHFGWRYLFCHKDYAMPMSASAARMSEGGSEYVDLTYYSDESSFLETLKSLNYQTIGTSTHGRKSLYALDLKTSNVAFFFGNEVRGLSKDLIKKLDSCVAIPSIGEVQSLNVAMASALFIGECVRQQGSKS